MCSSFDTFFVQSCFDTNVNLVCAEGLRKECDYVKINNRKEKSDYLKRGDVMQKAEREQELDLERKHEEDLQRLRGFRLLDDDFMSKVFEDKECTEFLLQIILNRNDLKVQSVHGQHDIKNLQGRSVRLDILAVDIIGRVHNIEIQRSDKGAGVKRARYNSSILDANITEAGDKYEDLNESYVIFI